jgi:hypothetical protein
VRTRALLAAVASLATAAALVVSASAPADAAPVPSVPGKQSASVTITSTGTTNLTLGEFCKIVGKASANLRGKPLRIMIKNGSTWQALATGRVQSNGTFTLWAKSTTAGRNKQIAAYAPATSTTKAVTSNSKYFTVYKWYDLTTLNPARSTGEANWAENYTWKTVANKKFSSTLNANYLMADTQYEPSEGGSIAYPIGKRCTTFQATAGWSDGSWMAYGSVRVSPDGKTVWSRSGLAQGTAVNISANITNDNYLWLSVTLDAHGNSMTYGDFVFGNPRVRCAF